MEVPRPSSSMMTSELLVAPCSHVRGVEILDWKMRLLMQVEHEHFEIDEMSARAGLCKRRLKNLLGRQAHARHTTDLEDGGGLEHLGHEGGDAPQLAVAGADAREDAVADGDARLVAGHEAANLRQQHHHAHLLPRGTSMIACNHTLEFFFLNKHLSS